MSAPPRLDGVDLADKNNPYVSQSQWRHQESSRYAEYASTPREANARTGSGDLADFFNKSRLQAPPGSSNGSHKPIVVSVGEQTNGEQRNGDAKSQTSNSHRDEPDAWHGRDTTLDVKCGPLLNYRRMENKTWFGSVLVVTDGGSGAAESPDTPVLHLRIEGDAKEGSSDHAHVGRIKNNNTSEVQIEEKARQENNDYNDHSQPYRKEDNDNKSEHYDSNAYEQNGVVENTGSNGSDKIEGTKLYSDSRNTFWRFDLEVSMRDTEIKCSYSIPALKMKGKKTDKQSFFIPAVHDSMRIMFHSCNGFSVGTDEEAWSGAALWNDVYRVHAQKPFHVMIGGGDQIYNDGIRVTGPLKAWTAIGNPHKRREFQFTESLRKECDDYYVNNYVRWYSTEPFASANGQIPALNIWDDHDIIDGFGSYVDEFMRCPVFRGIGGVANKYYLLFQHHLAPPPSTYTTDAPQTTGHDKVGIDPRQLENTYVLNEKSIDPSYIMGAKPGPYVVEHSRSIYARLGARIGFFGIDARTERTRKQVNYPETYKIIFERLRKELGAAKQSETPIQHLIVLLGIPIAYPRLTWLENIFSSPIIAPLKLLNKRFGFGGSLFNHFDGNIDLLDDLDDHYTARTHKKERLFLINSLQALAAEFSVRITILGGDVHLAAVGRFYSNLKLNIPVTEDHRYMANIISSAIVNKPPPAPVANLLAKRNKIHHLDVDTDETLMKFFDKDAGESGKTSSSNHVTMPSRNWAMITENFTHEPSPETNGNYAGDGEHNGTEQQISSNTEAKTGHDWLHSGEVHAGSEHKAADSSKHGLGTDGSLDVAIRVERSQHDKDGNTTAYGLTIPRLTYGDAADHHLRKRDAWKLHH